MKKNIEKIKQNTANKSLKELMKEPDIKSVIALIEANKIKGVVHPKLEKLAEIIHNQITENSKSKISLPFSTTTTLIASYFRMMALCNVLPTAC